MLAEKLLRAHAPRALLSFLFRHGQAADACQLLYPPDSEEPIGVDDGTSSSPITSRQHP